MFGAQTRIPIGHELPLVDHKKLHLKSIIHELLWFLRGDTNVKYLQRPWREHLERMGRSRRATSGRVYGAQWCDWRTPDGRSINQIDSRHPANPEKPRQPPSNCQRLERRRDRANGAPSMPHPLSILRAGRRVELPALPAQRRPVPGRALQHRLLRLAHPAWSPRFATANPATSSTPSATCTSRSNHLDQARLQLTRQPRPLPHMSSTRRCKNIHDFQFADFQLTGYNPHPGIKAPIAV